MKQALCIMSAYNAESPSKFSRIVLNEPHASVEGLYNPQLSYWDIDERFLNVVVVKWTDWHTDFLFHRVQSESVRTVRFSYSRFIVDAERLWDDPLEEEGQGIVYKRFADYTRQVPPSVQRYLEQLWKRHQAQLSAQLCDGALLLDCHSFPSDLSDVDICIGWNEDWSKPDQQIIETVANRFEDYGYKVGLNTPYSNSMTPSCDFRYKSMMIEVNKKTYLKPHSIELLTHGNKLSDVMASVIGELSVYRTTLKS